MCRKCVHFEPLPFSSKGKCFEPFNGIRTADPSFSRYPDNFDPATLIGYCNNFLEK